MTTAPSPPPSDDSSRRANRDDALAVVRRLRDAGHIAYFAGGCVRDQLLGLEPKDYDVATDAPPDRVRQLFSNTQAVGAAFGVILVRQRRSQIEVATFRTDGKYVDGRRPQGVVFTTAEEDAKRRDFTINGMFYDPIEDRVIDYVGGQDDLKTQLLRAIGVPDERFEEDHLRMLRAVRFASRHGFAIEPATTAGIKAHAEQLKRISPERVAEELRHIITRLSKGVAWQMLWDLDLMPVILRHLPERHERPDPVGPIFPFLADRVEVPFGLALAAMALCYRATGREDIGPLLERHEVQRTVQALRTGLKISNEEAELVAECTQLSSLLGPTPPTVAMMKRFLAKPHAREAREMLWALELSVPAYEQRLEWLDEQFKDLLRSDIAPPPLVTGDDLTAAGMKPGPVFKRVLDAVYDAQLEDRVRTKQDALQLALELAQLSS